MCVNYMESNLDVQSVAKTLILADIHRAQKLKSRCIDFITEQYLNVMSTEGWKLLMTTKRMDLMAELLKNLSNKYNA